MDDLEKIDNRFLGMKHLSSSEKYITEELTPIDLEILLSESRVESESNLIEEKKIYGGGFKLVGNSMSLRLEGTEYSTKSDTVHYILKKGDGVGVIREQPANSNSKEYKKMIDESLLGDLLLTFSHKEDDTMVHVLLPIFKTENSNLNGSEILKLVKGIAEGNTKKKSKDENLREESKNDKSDLLGTNQIQFTSSKNMSTNGFRDFETVNLTKMIKNEIPILQYTIENSIFLIFMSSSINVSKHALYNGSLIGLSEVTKTSVSGREWSGLKYYTNGIEVDTRKSMNCQPISDTGQVIKEINKGPSGEKREIDIIEQLEALTKTIPGQVVFGVIATIFLYLVVFSSMNIFYKIYKNTDSFVKGFKKEFGLGRTGIGDGLRAKAMRGNLKPQNKGKE